MKKESLRKFSRGILVVVMMSVCIFGLVLLTESEGFAKCEAALARLKQAEAELNAANAAFDAARQAAAAAKANLAKAIANLNAVTGKLGAQGKATAESATFGRSPTNPTFFDDPGYKAAKQAWQDAKAANDKAQGELDTAGSRRMRAQAEYDAAKAEYDKLRAEHIGDEGFLRAPEPLKVDKKLSEKVEELIQEQTLYKSVKQDDVSTDVGLVLRKTGGRTLLEVSILSTGKGIQFRKWSPEKVKLVMSSATLNPINTSNYYVSKKSIGQGVAPYIFSAIGSQYQGAAKHSKTSGEAVCSPSTQGAQTNKTAKVIDRAGMTIGMGVFSSQAKGEITGLRATFDVTAYEHELKNAQLKAVIVNEDAYKKVNITVPVSFATEIPLK